MRGDQLTFLRRHVAEVARKAEVRQSHVWSFFRADAFQEAIRNLKHAQRQVALYVSSRTMRTMVSTHGESLLLSQRQLDGSGRLVKVHPALCERIIASLSQFCECALVILGHSPTVAQCKSCSLAGSQS
jgi:hypothetical protein